MKNDNEEKTTCNLVITDCPIKIRNLFVSICDDYLLIDRSTAFTAMFKPFAELVINELSNHPNCNDEIIDALRHEVDQMFTPHHKGGGIIGF